MQKMLRHDYARLRIAARERHTCMTPRPLSGRRPQFLPKHSIHRPLISLHRLTTEGRHRREIPSVFAAAETPTEASSAPEETNNGLDLERFLSWLVANGVKGVGQDGSKVALFESDDGERGLVCEEPISAGEVVLEVPLRLALTDHPGDEESNKLLYPGAPWSVRLACKLLRHLAAADSSPWAPYIKVLPRHVPAPLESFSWEDISGLRYPAAQEALHSAGWLAADSFMSASEEARGGLGEEEFRWALSVVHSRTFANAAPGGGVGVRMLVPLIDMLNHGGDEAAGGTVGLGVGKPVATDSVRWDLIAPARSTTGGWAMALSATWELAPGQELLLSYGERPNDDFFLHYGFVPRANPHDDAVLWTDLESSLEWHYERLGAGALSRGVAESVYLAALQEGLREQAAELQQAQAPAPRVGGDGSDGGGGGAAAAAAGEATQEAVPAEVARQLAQIKVVAGGRVSAAVMRAFAAVSGGDAAAAERAVALRCAELLWNMTTAAAAAVGCGDDGHSASSASMDPGENGDMRGAAGASAAGSGSSGGLLVELAKLLVDADPRVIDHADVPSMASAVEGGDARYWANQLRGYCQVLLPRFAELLPEGPAAAAVVATAASAPVTAQPSCSGPSLAAGGGGNKSRYGLPPPALASSSASGPSQGAAAAAGSGVEAGGAAAQGRLVRALLLGGATAEEGCAAPAALQRLTGPQRLSAAFRCYKQMVLWALLLGSDVSPADLVAFARGKK